MATPTKLVRCPKCTRLLGILDNSDGTLHIKNGRYGTEILMAAKQGKIHLICPSEYFINEKGKTRPTRIQCGNKMVLVYEESQCLMTA